MISTAKIIIKRSFYPLTRRFFRFFNYLLLFFLLSVSAQLNSNPDKFLGNITTDWPGSMDYDGFVFSEYWDQVTPENSTKWASIEGSRGQMNWGGSDTAYNYARKKGFSFKFHCLAWGSQYPDWIKNLTAGEGLKAIENWMDGVKEKYPDLEMIDVVNEAVEGHQRDTYLMREALGGNGKTGYDWIIKAMEMAHERWPEAILIYNDFNTFQWNTDEYIELVRALRDAGAPIDAYGCQSHDLGGVNKETFEAVMAKIQEALKMPMYISEYDIGDSNDANQKWNFQQHFPTMWEADYCAGVTIWGWMYGHTWIEGGNGEKGISGLIKDGKERSALKWLREYMQTDAARTAKSPFPGMKKEASVYVKPASQKVVKGDRLPITVRASMATKRIEKIDLYVGDELVATMTEAPYETEYEASATGWKTIKAVVTSTDGSTYERLSRFNVARGTKREPYNGDAAELPGTIKAEEYDKGAQGVTYNDASRSTTTALKDGAWMEYSVDVKEDGLYQMEVEVASTKSGGVMHLAEYGKDNLTFLTNMAEVPNTGGASVWQTIRVPMMQELTAGRHVLTLMVDKGGFYIKSMTFKPVREVKIPGVVEAEDFRTCSGGISVVTGNGGQVIGNAKEGEWLEYTVNVDNDGKYSYEATVSSEGSGSRLKMTLTGEDGSEKSLGTISVPKTGSMDTYQVKTGKIRNALKAGKQTLRIDITGGNCNIDKIEFICTEPTGIIDVNGDDAEAGDSYNLSGQKVGNDYKGIVIRKGKKEIMK